MIPAWRFQCAPRSARLRSPTSCKRLRACRRHAPGRSCDASCARSPSATVTLVTCQQWPTSRSPNCCSVWGRRGLRSKVLDVHRPSYLVGAPICRLFGLADTLIVVVILQSCDVTKFKLDIQVDHFLSKPIRETKEWGYVHIDASAQVICEKDRINNTCWWI